MWQSCKSLSLYGSDLLLIISRRNAETWRIVSAETSSVAPPIIFSPSFFHPKLFNLLSFQPRCLCKKKLFGLFNHHGWREKPKRELQAFFKNPYLQSYCALSFSVPLTSSPLHQNERVAALRFLAMGYYQHHCPLACSIHRFCLLHTLIEKYVQAFRQR